jgi:beta-lactamase regulating signal transducer with metallopeptidase domain
MNVTASALLWCVVQVTVLALAATFVYLIARRLHPRAGAAAAGGGLVMTLMLTLLVASLWPRWDFSREASFTAQSATSEKPAANETISSEEPPESISALSRELDWQSPGLAFWSAFVETLNNPRPMGGVKPPAVGWLLWVGVLFALGTLVAGLRLVWALVQVRQLARSGRVIHDARLDSLIHELQQRIGHSQPIVLRETDTLSTPATIGWRHPVVLMPVGWRSWSEPELRAVMAHELAHIAGNDYAAWLVARLAVVAHFYHPLVRWLATRLQLEQELAADMAAAHLVGDSKQYLHSLASLALATPPGRIVGPARTLIPTRSLLVRRVEMLRTLGVNRSQRSWARYATFGVVAFLGLATAGLRGPGVAQSVAQAEEPATLVEQKSQYDFSYVPENIYGLLAIRPAEIAADTRLQPLAKLLDQATRPSIPSELMRQTTLVLALDDEKTGEGGEHNVLLTTRPIDFQKYLQESYPSLITKEHEGQQFFAIGPSEYLMGFFTPNETTLVGRRQKSLLTLLGDKDANQPPTNTELWQSEVKGPVLVVINERAFRMLIGQGLQSSPNWVSQIAMTLSPILQGVQTAIFSVEPGEQLKLHGRLICKSAEDAKRTAATFEAVAVLLRNTLDVQPKVGAAQPGFDQAVGIAKQAVDGRKITTDGNDVRIEVTFGETEPLVKLITDIIAPSITSARQAARRSQGMNNLKQLALAMLNYESARGRFPPAVGYTYRKDGEVYRLEPEPTVLPPSRISYIYRKDGEEHRSEYPHSWRVAILPYMEQMALYEQYQFDEPWDSEANLKVLAQMPGVFRSPHDEPSSTNTSYFVFTGPETLFAGEEGTQLREVRDGTARTLMLVETKQPVPWTKPEDIPYAAGQPVPKLGGWVPGEFLAAIADGSVLPVAADIDEATLRAWITKAGGEHAPDLPRPVAGGK